MMLWSPSLESLHEFRWPHQLPMNKNEISKNLTTVSGGVVALRIRLWCVENR